VSGSSVGNIASDSIVYDATLQNGAAVFNNQLVLSAAKSQYVSINTFTTGTAGLTFATWWKSVSSGTWARIFDFGNGATSDNVHIMQNSNNNNYLLMGVYNTSKGYYMSSSVRFNQNSWNHVAWTLYPSGTWIVYINGVQVTSASSKPYPRSISRSINYLGKSNWASDGYLDGAMKDFRMYSRVLSAVEISALFNATQTIFIGPTQCTNCLAGQYSFAGSESCLTCPAGQYSFAGSESCLLYPTIEPTRKYSLFSYFNPFPYFKTMSYFIFSGTHFPTIHKTYGFADIYYDSPPFISIIK
jgi:hypothetical protein